LLKEDYVSGRYVDLIGALLCLDVSGGIKLSAKYHASLLHMVLLEFSASAIIDRFK
jgi:hypothetical protein